VTVAQEHTLDGPAGVPRMQTIESNIVAFILAPRITTAGPIAVSAGASVTLDFSPSVGRNQRVVLHLGQKTIVVPPRPPPETDADASLTIDIPVDVEAGTYPLRVEVDGALSPLKDDSSPGSPGFSPSIVVS
jgi:hypothetical protein